MLQSLNYFRYINCPLAGTCNRPYCVFKHPSTNTTKPVISNQNESSQIETEKPETNKKTSDNLASTLEKVKSLINSCDTTIDPVVLKKQLDALLTQNIKNDKKPTHKSKQKLDPNIPVYNPTPIHELNKIKQTRCDSVEQSNGSDEQMNDDDDDEDNIVNDASDNSYENYNENEINSNNKRVLDDEELTINNKKLKNDLDTSVVTAGPSTPSEESGYKKVSNENDYEIKKLLQQKTDAVMRRMNNPLSYIASSGASSSLKIDRLSLQQQLLKRQEIVAAQKAKTQKQDDASSASSSNNKQPVKSAPVNQPKLIIDNSNKIPLTIRQRHLLLIFEESKLLFPSTEKACEKAAEQEKSIYDRAKTRNIYINLAANLISSLRKQNQKTTTVATNNSIKNNVTTTNAASVSKTTTATATNKTTIATKYNLKTTTTTTTGNKQVEINKNNLKLVNKIDQKNISKTQTTTLQQTRLSYSHEAILAGPKASKISYSINRKKTLTIKELNLSKLYEMLKVYVLTEKQLEDNGYPLVYKNSESCNSNVMLAYIPKSSSQQTTISKYSIQNHTITSAKYNSSSEIKLCKRCSKTFIINKNFEYIAKDECIHHWGKLRKVRINKVLEQQYSCCGQDPKSEGCSIGKHVYDGDDYETDQPLLNFVETKASNVQQNNIYALDCEMCYTAKGLELTRVSVVDTNYNLIYETIVVPDYEILDYNTRWSGLTKDSFKNCNIKLKNVQEDILKLFNKDTIIIGHSLESDFKALKLIHKTVVDTSIVFPHKMGPTLKRALRNLTSEFLQKIIQEDTNGHDSKEDACACMELMLWKIEQDLKK